MCVELVIRPVVDELNPDTWAAQEWGNRNSASSANVHSVMRQICTNRRIRHDAGRVIYESVPVDFAVKAMTSRLEKLSEDVKIFSTELEPRHAEITTALESVENIDDCLRADGLIDKLEIMARELRRNAGMKTR